MILRSLRLVHFRGLPEIRLGDAPERGVVRLPLPASAGPESPADALRFVLLGGAGESSSIVGEGQGLAFVEVALRTADGEDFSLFRGVDRRGREQVSLREEGGRRVAGGEAAAARLRELVGQPVAGWCERALGVDVPDDVSGAPARPVDDPAAVAAGEESARAAHRAVQELRRALRAERLRLLASRRHAELLELGRRLRHERGTVARQSDLESVERDRVRTRLRRVDEYRAQLARGGDDEAPEAPDDAGPVDAPRPIARPRNPTAVTEVVFLLCAACTFGALVLYGTSAQDDSDALGIQIGLGVGFAVAVASYLHVASRSSASAPDASDGAASEGRQADASRAWRASLRRRFADLGDPDAEGLPDELRRRLSELDARLSPLRTRLERLDDAVTVFDVEAGRAARALHEALPELGPGAEGLPAGSAVADAVSQVHELGDAVYAAVVERDALLAEGTATPAEARQALSVALDAMTDRIGAPGAVAALLRRVDSFACEVGEVAEEDHLADLLDTEIVRIEAEPPVWAGLDAARDAADGSAIDGLTVLATPADDLTDDDLVRRFGDAAQILVPAAAPDMRSTDRVRRPGTSRRPQ